MKKTTDIVLQLIPIVVMIILIPFIRNDYFLTLAYILIIFVCWFVMDIQKSDKIFFLFGFFGMIISESFFIRTGVEVFSRNSLFGLMPLWLPFLWGYSFIAMKKCIEILDKK